VRTIAFTNADAFLFSSVDELRNKMALDIGVSLSSSASTNQLNQTCINTTNTNGETTTNCSVVGNTTNDRLFSVGASMSYVRETFGRQEVYIVDNAEKTELYGILLDQRFIKHEVKVAIDDLSTKSLQTDPQSFFKFLETYGTHYVTAAIMGGTVTMRTIMEKNLTSDSTQTTTTTTGVSAQDALAAATSTFSAQLNTKVDFGLQKTSKSTQIRSTANWRLDGGDSSLVNLLDTRSASDTIKQWKSTIPENPVPVTYRLRNIATLFDDAVLRQQVAYAVDLYLLRDTSDVIRIDFSPSSLQ